ncbi:MAG: flagellar basal body L-ring protein FlgH [Phycisphaerae bacterium]|nr:flagellar basal body L-ring protein FlgH [Phycisphaerae bacterium]
MLRTSLTILSALLVTASACAEAPTAAPAAPNARPAPAPSAVPARPAPEPTTPRRRQQEIENRFINAVPSRPLGVQTLDARNSEPAPVRGGGPGISGGLTAVLDREPRTFKVHDLITILVSETSKAKSTADAKTDKKYALDAGISQFINFDFTEWSDSLQLSGSDLPQFQVDGKKKFDAKGNIGRQDDFSAKITAEVVEVMPNGTILVEAFKHLNMDGEEQTIRLSGVCRPEDVDASNIVQSHRLANAAIEKLTKGQLKDATEKGLIARVLDTLFAF